MRNIMIVVLVMLALSSTAQKPRNGSISTTGGILLKYDSIHDENLVIGALIDDTFYISVNSPLYRVSVNQSTLYTIRNMKGEIVFLIDADLLPKKKRTK